MATQKPREKVYTWSPEDIQKQWYNDQMAERASLSKPPTATPALKPPTWLTAEQQKLKAWITAGNAGAVVNIQAWNNVPWLSAWNIVTIDGQEYNLNGGSNRNSTTTRMINIPNTVSKDNSAVLATAGKTWITNTLPQGKTDSLPWVTKYAGQDQTAWGIKYWNNQAGIDLLNSQNKTPMEWVYNPTPTVATTQNPVIKKTLPKEEAPVKPDIQAMDLPTIQENIDRLTYKVNSGKSLTEDEYVTFNQLRRQSIEMMKPQSLKGWLDDLMQQQQSEITTTQQTQEAQNKEDMDAFTRSQEAFKQSQFAELERADEEKKKTLGYILWAQWAGTSSFGAEAINKITDNTAMQKLAYQDSIQAKIDLYESQQRKDSAETIQKMKDRLYSTQLKAAEFDVANLQEINKYNQEQSKSTLEKLDNLKAMSDSILASSTPLTEEQKQQAAVIWQFLVDPDGWLNQALLESYKKTNPNLIPYALSMAVGERNKIQENKLAMQWLDADIKKAQLNKLLNPAKEYEYVKDADWNIIAVAKDNPNERINITGGGEWLWDLRGLASQFPWQARAKNNNPAWITRNGNFDNPKPWTTAYALQQAGIQYNKGTPRPWNEWGNYVTFNTIEDWLAAQRIMMSQTYGNSTVGKMLQSRVWTWEWPNYAKQVAWMAGLDVNTPISQLSDEQLSTLQMSKIKKESPWLAKVLQSQWSGKQLSSVAKEAVRSWQINWTPTIQSGIIKELADSWEFDKWQWNSTFYTSKPAVKDEIANFAEWYAKRQQAKEIFNKLKADWTLWWATWWFDNLANKGKRFAGEWSSDVNNLNQILAESLSKYMNKISGATVSETEVERLREQIPNLWMWDKQFTDAFEQYDLSMQRWLDNTLTKYWFNSYDDVKQKIYWSNKSEQTQTTADPLWLWI